MNITEQTRFNLLYKSYLNELTLQGKSDNTIDSYTRCIRQTTIFVDTCPDQLTVEDLKTDFLHLVEYKSWSHVKITRCAIQFLYTHLLQRPWQWVNIVKPPVALSSLLLNHLQLRLTLI
jgi:integrase/recombinase XerD